MEKFSAHNEEDRYSAYDWILPIPPKPIFSITVSDEKGFCINEKLRRNIPERIKVGITSDGSEIGILEETEKGYRVPKNGTIKDWNLVQEIKTRGVNLPARYLVEKIDEFWQASLTPQILPTTPPKKIPKKPRKNGLKAMLPKKEIK
ncbi:hypothetical protein [Paenibacillus sp. A14]|uniref:hypothetical protein n=1 Tax=Paenibacillus sp. A14 TaxID=3119820 RepID=UPI002FE3A841